MANMKLKIARSSARRLNGVTMASAWCAGLAGAAAGLGLPEVAWAAGEASLDGRALSWPWALPFIGILLSIAVLPLLAASLWHHHFGKIALLWALAFIVPCFLLFGFDKTRYEVLHTLLLEYIPFIILVGSLYTVAGGIFIKGNIHGSPATNTAMLAFGTFIASFVGTTGASMLMIRPMIRANDDRAYNVHVFVFFIFLVSNVGGGLTPLGDPPLFLGFLQGVDFFWTLEWLWRETLLVAVILLALFFAIDTYHYRKEGRVKPDPTPDSRIRIEGTINLALLAALIGLILWSGFTRTLGTFTVFGVELDWKGVVRDVGLVVVALLSLALTPKPARDGNGFSWGPILEVAKLFAAIFITIVPVLAMLRAGKDGPAASLIALVTLPDGRPNDVMYFWLTGLLSSFLDNAPTYLVFFNLAAASVPPDQAADFLMTKLPMTLAAISLGAVFMGANSYIGNAPNFMVKAVCEEKGVKMPSFFGYMAWSCAILLPCFALLTVLFF
jgi:Na+/H+ antiporter NhaD/arsenite permease-like protein